MMCVHNCISTWWVGPRHQNIIPGVSASLALFFSCDVKRGVKKITFVFYEGVVYVFDNFKQIRNVQNFITHFYDHKITLV